MAGEQAPPKISTARAVKNRRCAIKADKAVALYRQKYEHDDTALTDLLTDLMHWCDSNKIDFHDTVRVAKNHHWAETTPPELGGAEDGE